MKLSIIIPVYNVEKYIERCMETVLPQLTEHMELIIVDDGSTDDSGNVCDRYQKAYPALKVIHQENKGLGEARNTGLCQARGEYIMFLDSDDYVENDAFIQLLTYVENNICDICYFGHYRVVKGQAKPYGIPPEKLKYVGKTEILGELLTDTLHGNEKAGNCFTGMSAWCGLYRTELLREHNIHFQSERKILSEDILFNLEICACSEIVLVCPKYLYYYEQREGSLTREYRPDRFWAALSMDGELVRLARAYGAYDVMQKGIDYVLGMNLVVCLKQELFFEKQIGYKKVMEHVRVFGKEPRVILYLQTTAKSENIERRILFHAMSKRWWRVSYVLLWLQTKIKR